MTPEQIEKEREAFESYIMAAYTDPKTGVLKQDWKLKRDGEGYFWRNPSTAWKAWLARAEQSVWIRAEDMLPAEGSAAIVLYRDCGQLLPSIGYYCEDSEMFFDENKYEIWDVTHWQPLPTLPKGI